MTNTCSQAINTAPVLHSIKDIKLNIMAVVTKKVIKYTGGVAY